MLKTPLVFFLFLAEDSLRSFPFLYENVKEYKLRHVANAKRTSNNMKKNVRMPENFIL